MGEKKGKAKKIKQQNEAKKYSKKIKEKKTNKNKEIPQGYRYSRSTHN